jgi:hypothetical protein
LKKTSRNTRSITLPYFIENIGGANATIISLEYSVYGYDPSYFFIETQNNLVMKGNSEYLATPFVMPEGYIFHYELVIRMQPKIDKNGHKAFMLADEEADKLMDSFLASIKCEYLDGRGNKKDAKTILSKIRYSKIGTLNDRKQVIYKVNPSKRN